MTRFVIGSNIGLEAGKALAESILDLTGHNPWSRISNTDFRSLEGMRRWLLKRLQNSPDYNGKSKDTTLKMSSSSSLGGVLSTSLLGFDLSPDLRGKVRSLKRSTSYVRKGSCSKIPDRPSFGPLVPKKENQNSNTSLVKPSGSKSKVSSTDKATSSTMKGKTKIAATPKEDSSVQPKGSITKVYKVKRVLSRKKTYKTHSDKSDSNNTLAK